MNKDDLFGIDPTQVTRINVALDALPYLLSAVVDQRVTWLEGSKMTEFDYLGFRYRMGKDEDGNIIELEKTARIDHTPCDDDEDGDWATDLLEPRVVEDYRAANAELLELMGKDERRGSW